MVEAMLTIAIRPLLPSFDPGGQQCLYIRAASTQFLSQLAKLLKLLFPKATYI
jgi:hypothetical protein